ncbi:MAG: pseudouridine-5'-phosphate glycosidase, partial [Polyangiaceae bacterium]|nr:pseudouridine-5'-phosphate glycosidase [Polyangiaceae bacterium]
MNKLLSLHPEVAEALQQGAPVVALESTIISHGMPYPQNVDTALEVEIVVRRGGAVPATIAVIGGRVCVGLTRDQILILGRSEGVRKVSTRDLPMAVVTGAIGNVMSPRGTIGATTVAASMICAKMAGIPVFATGGIGGVHRGGEDTMDVSADLIELARTSV